MSTRLIEVARALVADPGLVETPVQWFVNGQRGLRHSRSNCVRIRKGVRLSVLGETPEQALARACPDCWEDGLIGAIAPSSRLLARKALPLMGDMRAGLERVRDDSCTVEELAGLVSVASAVLDQLGHLRTLERREPDSSGMVDRLEAAAAELHAVSRRFLAGKRHEVARAVAASIVAEVGTRSTSGVTEAEFNTMSPVARRSHWNVGSQALEVRQSWFSAALCEGSTGSERLRSMRSTAAGIPLTLVGQLASVTPLRPRPGESGEDAALRAWRATVDSMVVAMHQRWEEQLRALLDQSELKAAGLAFPSRARYRDIVGQVAAAYEAASSADRRLTVIEAPAFVVDWMAAQAAERPGCLVQTVDAPLGTEASQTAVALWEPDARDGSTYVHFDACASAARALLA